MREERKKEGLPLNDLGHNKSRLDTFVEFLHSIDRKRFVKSLFNIFLFIILGWTINILSPGLILSAENVD